MIKTSKKSTKFINITTSNNDDHDKDEDDDDDNGGKIQRQRRKGSINALNSSSQWGVKGEEILYKFDKLGNR